MKALSVKQPWAQAIVDVKTKIGDVFERYVADKFHWKHHGSEGDIIAYRIVK